MAIIIEERKRGFGFLNSILWLAIVGVIFFATYYIFFKTPEIFDVVLPAEEAFKDVERLSKITLDPEIINSPAFKSLTIYVTVPESGKAGRLNPFSPP